MMNRRGEEEEGLVANASGVILALVATVIIVAFIYLAIVNITQDSEEENAQATIESIIAKIDALSEDQELGMTLRGFETEEDWYLLGWSKNSLEERPEACFLSGCICLCQGQTASDCKEKGICETLDYDNVELITNSLVLFTYGRIHDPCLEEINSIMVDSKLTSLRIRKQDNKITILKKLQEGYEEYEPCQSLEKEV